MQRNRKRIGLSIICAFTGLVGLTSAAGVPKSIARETLVWSDEFNRSPTGTQPDPANWTYDIGAGGWGNGELETYCSWASDTAPCKAAEPNTYLGGDGFLHIVARSRGDGVYTSARLKSLGLRSFQYGRVEARIRIPQGQGVWPAFWMMGDDIASVGWPACGEFDIMENIGKEPSSVHGSIHGPGVNLTKTLTLPDGGKLADGFHNYGMIWSPGRVQFYLDSPANVYGTFIPADLPAGAVWPFDKEKFFLLLNLAAGGYWPGAPDASTKFPKEMLVDYVRVYAKRG